MKNKKTYVKTKFIVAGIFLALFAALLAAVLTLDVSAVGPAGTSVGLSSINSAVHSFFKENDALYTLTELLGYAALAVVACFALVGLVQLVKRKSLFKVDRAILALGVLYVIVGALYVLFEKVIINYRPVIESGAEYPEASFPSSHTMLVCVVLGSAMMLLKNYIKIKPLRTALYMIGALSIALTVCGRLICGVHWLTDIIAGVLLSLSLLFLYSGALDIICLDSTD